MNYSFAPFLFAKDYEKLISDLIDQKKYNDASDLVCVLVNSLCMDSKYMGKQFFLPDLDKLVQRLAEEIILPKSKKLHGRSGCPVIVATEMYSNGGHSRIIEEIIRIQGGTVVLTNYFGSLRGKGIQPSLPDNDLPLMILPPDNPTNNIIRLNKICNQMASEIYVLTHQHDVVANAALSHSIPVPIFFIHHSDHRVSLGANNSKFIHVDIAPHMHEFCTKYLHRKPEYWPQGAEDHGAKIFSYPLTNFCTASSGSWHKFAWDGDFAYPSIIRRLLKSPGFSHYHIGELPDFALNKIKKELHDHSISADRFHYVSHVKSLWLSLLDLPINIFLGSTPIPGYRTAIEVQGAGIPIIPFLESGHSIFNAKGFYSEITLFWNDPDKLPEVILDVVERHRSLSFSSRAHYENNFQTMLMKEAIDKSISLFLE